MREDKEIHARVWPLCQAAADLLDQPSQALAGHALRAPDHQDREAGPVSHGRAEGAAAPVR
jgi:hypothetical protein